MKKIFTFLLVLFCLIMTVVTFRSHIQIKKNEIRWSKLIPMIAPRSNTAVVQSQKKLYVIGGNDKQGATNTVWVFNPTKEDLTELPKLNFPRFAHEAAVYDHKLYVFGGMQQANGKTTYLDSVEMYDIQAKQWSVVARMPEPRARFGLAEYGGRLYLIGGVNSISEALKSVDIYNPKTNHWRTGLALPASRNRLAALDVDHHLYVIGGSDKKHHAINSTLEYFPKLNRWKKVGMLNQGRNNFAATVWHKKIYVVGGWTKNRLGMKKFIASTEQFNPKTHETKVVGYLPKGRDGVRIHAIQNKMYLFGGYNKKIKSDIKVGQLLM